jgi:threonylcarbamoyladenosine tRNA methylthiotransferase MtaB
MRIAIKTLGCRLNQAESAELAARFQARGFEVVPFGADCDACLIHSCAVTAAAERESVRLSRAARRRCPSATIVLAGCVAETASSNLADRSGADWVVPQKEKPDLPEKMAARFGLAPHFGPKAEGVAPLFDSTRALLRVQDGCSFCCAYCIVPRARGPSRSRPMNAIVAEARLLADRGHKEIVLTGANLGTWQDGERNLIHLLERIERIEGIARLRVGSVEPATIELPLIAFMANSAKLCRYLHMPMQSGDDGILASMGRRYTVGHYRAVLEKALSLMPLVGLGTDIVTGFPGESDSAFRNTKALVESYPFSNLHVFPYSERPETRAVSMPDSVPPLVRRGRARELILLGENLRQAFARRHVGRTVTVLVERQTRDNRAVGWTGEYLEAILSETPAAPKRVVTFTAKRADGGRLFDFSLA